MTVAATSLAHQGPGLVFNMVDDYFGSFTGAPPLTQTFLRLSNDPAGGLILTLTNVVVGSRYRIERQGDGSLATPTANAEGVAAASTVVIPLDYYAAGNANNNIKIKVRKGTTAPKYGPFDTQATLGPGAKSSYVAQVADPIA